MRIGIFNMSINIDEVYASLLSSRLGVPFTFSQNFEDIRMSRVFPGNEGFFVDVGSCLPVDDSCTFLFSRRGWRGVCIDAIPQREDMYRQLRPNDILISSLVGNTSNTRFYQITKADGALTGLSTESLEIANKAAEDGFIVTELDLPIRTLTSLLKDSNVPKEFEILSVDVEGHAKDILSGDFFNEFSPKLICLETTVPRSPALDNELIDYVKSQDYVEVVHDGLNSFFARKDLVSEFSPLAYHFSPFVDDNIIQWKAYLSGILSVA